MRKFRQKRSANLRRDSAVGVELARSFPVICAKAPGEAARIVGAGERTSRSVLALAIEAGLLVSATPKSRSASASQPKSTRPIFRSCSRPTRLPRPSGGQCKMRLDPFSAARNLQVLGGRHPESARGSGADFHQKTIAAGLARHVRNRRDGATNTAQHESEKTIGRSDRRSQRLHSHASQAAPPHRPRPRIEAAPTNGTGRWRKTRGIDPGPTRLIFRRPRGHARQRTRPDL